MSDSELELFEDTARLLAIALSCFPSGLPALGVVPAPLLGFSQLLDLADEANSDSPDRVQSPPAPSSVAAPGWKHSRKSLHPELLDLAAAGPAVAPPPGPASDPPGEALTSTMLVLASSLKSIDARLRSLESARASTSAAAVLPPVIAPLPALASLRCGSFVFG